MESSGAKEKRRAYAHAYYRTHRKECLAYQRRYRQERAEKIRLRKQRYRETHEEQIRAYDKKYREEHREQCLTYQREYRQTHPKYEENMSPERREAYRAVRLRWYWEHRDESIERRRKWRQTDRGRTLAKQSHNKRRALKAGVANTLTSLEWQNALVHFAHRCAYCGNPAERLHQDHVIPLSAAGGYVVQNIVPACARCNLSKHSTRLDVWTAGRGAAFVLPEAPIKVREYIEGLGV